MMQNPFAKIIVDLFQEKGAAWLENLPAQIARWERRWNINVQPPFPDLSYNYAAPAVREDGTRIVLKAGVPDRSFTREIEALRLYSGQGSVHLLEADPQEGVMLLERLEPGTMLSTLEDDATATSIAAQVMKKLWRSPPAEHDFVTLEEWTDGLMSLRAEFDGGTGPFAPERVEEATGLRAELLASAEAPVLLHGDLHHFNILAAERDPWLAIDPKGIVGDRAYEVGSYFYNPCPAFLEGPEPGRLLARRVDQFADVLELDWERVCGWGIVQSALSAWWSYEDHGEGWEQAMECAALLSAIRKRRAA